MPLWEILTDETSVNTLAGRSAKSVNQFAQMILSFQDKIQDLSATQILNQVMEASGYVEDLKSKGTDEADNRVENILELYNAISQFQEDNEDASLTSFLANASLSSDLDGLEEGQEKVSMMSLHAAKGLEFPIVFLVGLEQGLFPHSRSLNDPMALEEERRLCYVGITRAQEQLFLTYTRERRLWGSREAAIPSQFLKELPKELISSNVTQAATKYRHRPIERETKVSKYNNVITNNTQTWNVGDRVHHNSFGEGEVTHLLGEGNKQNLAIKFSGLGQKIIDPRIAPIEKI
jgi:DNA helicase II / ATP-dependent DNA helicase PcrA